MRFLRRLFGEASEPAPLESAANASMEDTLRKLGLPLDFSVTDPQTALIGGLARATIFHGYQLLRAS